jgi:hypothetical protein
MSGHMPPIPPGNQSNKGPKQNADDLNDTTHKDSKVVNTSEQGETANIKQNTTNKGFFQGRRVK